MVRQYKPVRRVVTGNNADGRSCVLYDSDVPNMHPRPNSPGTFFFEVWNFENSPAPISGTKDANPAGLEMRHSPPANGAHWRLVHSSGEQKKLDAKQALESHQKMNSTGASQLMEGGRHWNMHRTPTVDYAFCLKGERHLVLSDTDVLVQRGDIVVQLANWHAWDNRSKIDVDMGYVMIGGEFPS